MLLYHGSKEVFSQFHPAFYKTGEGVGHYLGWYFCSTPKGALYHCEKYLECRPYGKGGYIYSCEIDDEYLDSDIDGCFTEHQYVRPIFGVKLERSEQIVIVDRIEAFKVFVQIYGDIR